VEVQYFNWKITLDYIVARNAMVDVSEQKNASSHFDSESFIAASQLILQRYQSAVSALNSLEKCHIHCKVFIIKPIFFAFYICTNYLDFYSHSNWIELSNRVPQPDLAANILTAVQFAGPIIRTCTNCATGVCTGNNDVTKGLTSGYFKLLVDIPNSKPTGKCSHGGSFDATDDNDATGGINKDTLISVHGYLHVPAAQTAYLATCDVLRKFRTQVLEYHKSIIQFSLITFSYFMNKFNC
jgi:hypothetical protein